MTEEQHYEEIEALGKRFAELSYNEAPIDEIMKAFNEWNEARDTGVVVRRPSGSSRVTDTSYDDALHNIKR